MMNGKRMTWAEIKKAYPKQLVGLVDCKPEDVGFETAVVKYTSENTTREELYDRAFDGEIYLLSTTFDDDERLVL